MRYSVCVIDNDIPASGAQAQVHGIADSDLLNSSNLQLLLQEEQWGDEILKSLIEKLVTQRADDGVSPKWEVYGFTNPSFYINAINDGCFRSDLLVFDWEYPGAQNTSGINPETILKEILDRTFCLVFIFSKADKKEEIDAILAKREFQAYKERLRYLDKSTSEGEQTGPLLANAQRMYAENFSFKFAGVLRRRCVQCADQILSDMGRASLNDVKNLLALGEGGKKDFVDFLAERFRAAIANPNIYDLVEQIPESSTAIDATLASNVWSYRLYFQQETGDVLVRRGDIVAVDDEVLLVLSADCDLTHFWLKNFGIINAVALHELNQSNAILKAMLTVCLKCDDLVKPIGSLLSKIGDLSEGPFVLPFVPAGGGLKNFVAIPKDLVSRRVPTPAGWAGFTKNEKRWHPMKYEYWSGARRLCTVSEPFLTPVIQHIFNTIGGTGVPDYPENMKGILRKILEDFSAASAAAPAAAPGGGVIPTAPTLIDIQPSTQPATVAPAEIPAQATSSVVETTTVVRDQASPAGSPAKNPTGEIQ